MTTNRNCTECGTVAEPGQSFCDACGSVLSWAVSREGDRQQTTAPEPAPAPASAGPAPASASPAWDAFTGRDGSTGLPRRDARATATTAPPEGRGELRAEPPLTETTATADTTPLPAAAPQAAGGAQPPQGPPAPEGESRMGGAGGNNQAEDEAERARRLLIPVQDTEPAPPTPPSVTPVLPGRPTPQRPQSVRAPGEDLGAHGGTPCPWCATPNRPDRHFCTRCAMPMAGNGSTAHSAHRPWWRRLFDFRNRETPWAGDRPRLRRTFDRVLTWIGAAVILALVTVLAINIPNAVSATRDHFAKRAQVSPDHVSASRSYAGHKPDLVFDKLNNTWWGPGVTRGGEGEWIEARFDEPTRLLNLVITSGESTRYDQLKKSALPHRMKAVIKTSDGKTETREITLDQSAGGQTRDFRAKNVTSVRFTIESSYQASAGTQVAIAEIEFFGPSSANSS
ncbi:zinc ribbon domain-containing protein [Streptomyces sp. NPDC005917]|uniref:zinc ribbon domain-containing protein n=1 Tax=unclassified Streptomyces TaxID=2593676 RepID=UPI0033EBBB23